jgi:beta-lactamase regulating signal transducer with metallopeptidase domain
MSAAWFAFMCERAVAGLLALPLVAVAWAVARRRGAPHLASALLAAALVPLALPLERLVPATWIPRPLAALFAPLRIDGAATSARAGAADESTLSSPPSLKAVQHGGAAAKRGGENAGTTDPSDVSLAAPAATAARGSNGSPLVTALFAGWLAVVALLLARLVADLRRTRRALARARPLAPAELPLPPAVLARRAGLARLPPIVASAELPAPSTCGVLSPVVVLPPALHATLGDEGLRFVLLHELAHVRRRDPLLALLERLVRIAWFLHPTAWLAGSLLARERERACDDAALATLPVSARPDCAEALFRVVERASGHRPLRTTALALTSGGRAVKERLLRIVDPAAAVAARMSPRSHAAFGLCSAVLLLVLAARVAPPAQQSKLPDPPSTPADTVRIALRNGFEWLERHQESDGHFSAADFDARCKDPGCAGKGEAHFDVGVTAFAASALLGAGDQEPEKSAAARALDWLVTQQNRESGLIAPGGKPFSHMHYGHVYATLALVDGFGGTGTERWKVPAQKGLDYLLRARNPYKGWRYGVRDGDNDSSLTGSIVYVLAGSRSAGFKVDDEALNGGLAWLDDMTDAETGRTGYQQKGGFPARTVEAIAKFPASHSEALTAIAMNARIPFGQLTQTAPLLAKGAALLAAQPPQWNEAEGTVDYYYWYHATRALFLMSGTAWKEWKSAVVRELTAHQSGMSGQTHSDCVGSFPPADAWSAEGGRVYATAINLLTLEICARDR